MIAPADRPLTRDEKSVLRALANCTPVFTVLTEISAAAGLYSRETAGVLERLTQLGLVHPWQHAAVGLTYILTAKAAGQLKVRLDWSAGANRSRWVASAPGGKKRPARCPIATAAAIV